MYLLVSFSKFPVSSFNFKSVLQILVSCIKFQFQVHTSNLVIHCLFSNHISYFQIFSLYLCSS